MYRSRQRWIAGLVIGIAVCTAGSAHAVEISVPGDYPTITDAIFAAGTGDEIVVSPGTYTEAVNFGGKDIVVRSLFGSAFTTIDAAGTSLPAVTIASGEPATARLEGFTITGGDSLRGGGLRIEAGAIPTILDCVFTGNTAERGGGIYVGDASALIVNCTLTDNTCTNRGAGLAAFLSSSVTIYNSTFAENVAVGDGAGIVVHGSTLDAVNIIVRDNVSTVGAGGGIACVSAATATFTNASIAYNTALSGGAIFNAATLTLTNCVSWFNAPDEILVGVPGTQTVTYSNVSGGYTGTGNIDLNPQFNDGAAGDLRLTELSPCIDSGNSAALPTDADDLDGDGNTSESTPFDRLGQGRRFDEPSQPDTGAGTVPIVDMGAVEYHGDLFEAPEQFAASGEGIYQAVGDYDGDGDEDLAIVIRAFAPATPGSAQVFLNDGVDGDGVWLGFTALAPFAVGVDPSGIATGLLDDDATLDLAVTNEGDDTLTYYLNPMGDASFSLGGTLVTGSAPTAVAIADLSGDAKVEIAVANGGDATVTVWERVGPLGGGAAYVEQFTAPVGERPVALDPEDLDEDRDTDIVVVNEKDGTISALMFQGGSVINSIVSPTGVQPVDLDIGDVDGDGFLDVVTANRGDDTVSVLLGGGDGAFGPNDAKAVGMAPESVALDDFDGDLDPDVAVTAEDPDIGRAVQVLENNAAPGLPDLDAPVAYAVEDDPDVEAQPNFVSSADLDGDGLADLVTVNGDDSPSGGSVSALLSTDECPGDVDGDGATDFADVLAILAAWGPCPAPPAGCPEDLNGNGSIDFNDLLLALGGWGGCLP